MLGRIELCNLRLFRMITSSLLVLLLSYSLANAEIAFEKIHESPYHQLYSSRAANKSCLALSSALEERITDLQITLGVYPHNKVKIYIVHGEQDYNQISQGRNRIIEFSDAFYSGSEGVIYIRSQDQITENYLHILIHEYIHWYLDQLFISTPLWFHEGMATHFSGQMGYERFLFYLKESLINPHSDLFRIGFRYPTDRQDWPRFYTSSAMAIRFMKEKHNQNWLRFWDITAQSHREGHKIRFSQAFVSSYHQSLWDFQKRFEEYSKKQGYLYLAVAINSMIFALLPIVVIAIYIIKRKKRMQELPDLPEPAALVNDHSQTEEEE